MGLGVQPLTPPCNPVNILTIMADDPSQKPPAASHLLLVDDEESLRSVVAERLSDHGFEVVEAISKVPKGRGDRPVEPVVIEGITISETQ